MLKVLLCAWRKPSNRESSMYKYMYLGQKMFTTHIVYQLIQLIPRSWPKAVILTFPIISPLLILSSHTNVKTFRSSNQPQVSCRIPAPGPPHTFLAACSVLVGVRVATQFFCAMTSILKLWFPQQGVRIILYLLDFNCDLTSTLQCGFWHLVVRNSFYLVVYLGAFTANLFSYSIS